MFAVLFLLYIILYHNNGDARAWQTPWGTDFFVFLVLFIRFFVLFVCVWTADDGRGQIWANRIVRTDGRGFHRADAHARAVNETAAVIQHHIVQVLYLYMRHIVGEKSDTGLGAGTNGGGGGGGCGTLRSREGLRIILLYIFFIIINIFWRA